MRDLSAPDWGRPTVVCAYKNAYQFLVTFDIPLISLSYCTFLLRATFPALPNMSATIDQSSPATRVATPIPGEKLNALEQVSSFPSTVVAELEREDDVLANASTARKLALMALFSAAQFLDVFNNRYVHTLC